MTAVAVVAPAPSSTEAPLPDHCEPGRPWPLGATLTEHGVNFAVFSSIADKVEICLFDRTGTREVRRYALPCRTDDVWHGFLPGLPAGARYGLRVHGPYQPQNGLRCNPNKLLLDPYAKALDRPLRGGAWQYGYTLGGPARDLAMDTADNGAGAAKCVVLDTGFDWGDDRRPGIPLEDTVFYEVHVRGFTKLMDEVPHGVRGTFSGWPASRPSRT
jgi:isoamylase